MTKETRIGLLVGLGFIIMFGLVLTEMTGSDEPSGLPSSVQEEARQLAFAPVEEISPAIIDHSQAVPRLGQPVNTAPSPGPTVALSASAEGEPTSPDDQAHQHADEQPEIVAVAAAASDAVRTEQADAAQDSTGPVVTSAAEIASVAAEAPTATHRTYVVQPNDSLIKIAVKLYGKGHEADYKRIYEANKCKLRSPSIVLVGQELVIPPLAAAGATDPSPEQADLAELRARLGSSPPSAAEKASGEEPARSTYTTRRGDTLTKIARKTLKDGSRAAVMRILAANKDKLSHPDRLPVGVELVIPG